MRKQKIINKKTIYYISFTFILLFISAVVFAATTGILTLRGSVSRGNNANLDFVKAHCDPTEVTTGVPVGKGFTLGGLTGGNYNCGISLEQGANLVNGFNDVLTWGIYLREAGDTQSIKFSIKNVGNAPVDLVGINITEQTGFGTNTGEIELTGTGLSIPSQCLDIGEEIGPFTLNVYWPVGDLIETNGAIFKAFLDYSQATSACP